MYRTLTRTAFALALLLGAASTARAITVSEVIDLAQAGAESGVILAKIDADQTVFQLTVDEILELSDAGVPDHVITYMINTGKSVSEDEPEAGDEAASEAEGEVYDEDEGAYEEGDDDGGTVALGAAYSNTGFGVTVGYYYPSWPGYYYSVYYDPFYWPGWGYYYAWCSPYPYWRWYQRTYACYPYSYRYWYRCSTPWPYYGKHHGHGYVHDDYRDHYVRNVTRDGRYVGSRGTVHRGRGDSDLTAEAVAANNRVITSPRRPKVKVERADRAEPAPSRGYTLRRPRTEVRSQKTGEVVTPRRVPDRSPQVTPRKRVKVTPQVTPRKTTTPRRVEKPSTRKRPVKVTPKKRDDGNTPAAKPAPQRTPKSSPKVQPQRAPSKSQPSRSSGSTRRPTSRRGGGGH